VKRPVLFVSERHLWITAAAGAVLLVGGIALVSLMLPRLFGTAELQPAAETGPLPVTDTRRISATVYYLSNDRGGLIPVTREVPYGATPPDQVRYLVDAAVTGPNNRRSAIPNGTTIRSVFLAGGHAFVDLGGTIVSGHPGGSLGEALTVYAIVNTITVNLPNISAVQILVNGQQVDTLAGHLDLRYPLSKALDWVQKGS
jgi:spore germination protein GerM